MPHRKLLASSRRWWPRLLILSIGFITVIAFLYSLKLLQVTRVVCFYNSAPCPQEIETLITPLVKKNYLLVKPKEIISLVSKKYPITKTSINYSFPQKVALHFEAENKALNAAIYLSDTYPKISSDQISSDSAAFVPPTEEIVGFLADKTPKYISLQSTGNFTDSTEKDVRLRILLTKSPDSNTVGKLYRLVNLSKKYLDNPEMYLVGERLFLRQSPWPDIIIYVSADLTEVESSLQSLEFIAKIKSDAKVVDLSFKHPIIK